MTESLLMAEPLLLLWVSAHSGGKQAPKIGDCVCCPSCFIRNRSLRILLPCLFLFAEEPLESSNLYHQRHEQNEKSHPGCPLLKALLLLVTTLESKLPAWKNLWDTLKPYPNPRRVHPQSVTGKTDLRRSFSLLSLHRSLFCRTSTWDAPKWLPLASTRALTPG